MVGILRSHRTNGLFKPYRTSTAENLVHFVSGSIATQFRKAELTVNSRYLRLR
jgi:hypothetical protein